VGAREHTHQSRDKPIEKQTREAIHKKKKKNNNIF
jgi:hypothetical protein